MSDKSTKRLALGAMAAGVAGLANQYFPIPATMIPFPEYVGPVTWALAFTLGFGALVRAWPWADRLRHSHGSHPVVLMVVGAIGAASFIAAWLIWGPKATTTSVADSATPATPVEIRPAPFGVILHTNLLTDTCNEAGLFWVIMPEPTGRVRTPTQLAAFLAVANRQSVPSRVVQFHGEGLDSLNQWRPLTSISLLYSSGIYIGDPHKARPVSTMMPFLDQRLRAAPITAGDVIEGWMLFAYPPGFRRAQPFKLRITIEDAAGATFTTEAMTPSELKPGELRDAGHLVPGGPPEDISLLPLPKNWPQECK